MKCLKDDLDCILENGFTDIDINDPFQVVAKINLHFLTCPQCNLDLDLTNHGLPIEITDFKFAGNLIKSLGWGFLNLELKNSKYLETEVICPDCLGKEKNKC